MRSQSRSKLRQAEPACSRIPFISSLELGVVLPVRRSSSNVIIFSTVAFASLNFSFLAHPVILVHAWDCSLVL